MNTEDIVRMAREAGWSVVGGFVMPTHAGHITHELERFADLVACAERSACEALHDHEDVQAPIGNSSWGEVYQEGWGQGTAAYRDAIRARGQA